MNEYLIRGLVASRKTKHTVKTKELKVVNTVLAVTISSALGYMKAQFFQVDGPPDQGRVRHVIFHTTCSFHGDLSQVRHIVHTPFADDDLGQPDIPH
jgi:hypothetical protein